ncbi:MAG: hypothetical protein IIU77_01350 [Clostridia bacterium]|nr:hypothetical protein [Clostridia bacterium]
MLSYKPKRYMKNAIIAEALLFFVLIALAVIAALNLEYKVVSQGLVFVVAAGILYIAMRYMLAQYTYTVSEDSFEVSRLLGKIPNTLILAEISENDSIVRISGRKDLKKYGVTKIENVCANLAPHGLYAYISVSEGKKTAILIECDELFYLAVSERINMKKFAKKDTKEEETED